MTVLATIGIILICLSIFFWTDIIKLRCRCEVKRFRKEKEIVGLKVNKCHFSVDDTINIFKDLAENHNIYKSIFDNRILAYLRKLHDVYGVTVSLYCFYEDNNGFDLSMAPDIYADEFKDNADWMKFGFHGRNYNVTYDKTTAYEAERDYKLVVGELQRICGGLNSLTRVVRLSSFCGNAVSIQALNQCPIGISGLFTADDERHSYDLSITEENKLRITGYIKRSQMNYYHTDMRIERSIDKKFIKKVLCNQNICVVFTHEYYIMSRKIQKKLELLLLELIKKKYDFSFLE